MGEARERERWSEGEGEGGREGLRGGEGERERGTEGEREGGRDIVATLVADAVVAERDVSQPCVSWLGS